MRNDDEWVAAALALRRMNQDCLEFQTISRLVSNRFLLRELALAEERIRIGQPDRSFAIS